MIVLVTINCVCIYALPLVLIVYKLDLDYSSCMVHISVCLQVLCFVQMHFLHDFQSTLAGS